MKLFRVVLIAFLVALPSGRAWCQDQVVCQVRIGLGGEPDPASMEARVAEVSMSQSRRSFKLTIPGGTVDGEEFEGDLTFTNSKPDEVLIFESATGGAPLGGSTNFPLSGTSFSKDLWIQVIEPLDEEGAILTATAPNSVMDTVRIVSGCSSCSGSDGFCTQPNVGLGGPGSNGSGGGGGGAGGSGSGSGFTGININLPLGNTNFGEQAGSLNLFSSRPSAGLSTPAGFTGLEGPGSRSIETAAEIFSPS